MAIIEMFVVSKIGFVHLPTNNITKLCPFGFDLLPHDCFDHSEKILTRLKTFSIKLI